MSFGALLAHRLPRRRLEIGFGVFLIAASRLNPRELEANDVRVLFTPYGTRRHVRARWGAMSVFIDRYPGDISLAAASSIELPHW